ncbi:hypothetical protein OROHE_015153 [Orobanche hederae]
MAVYYSEQFGTFSSYIIVIAFLILRLPFSVISMVTFFSGRHFIENWLLVERYQALEYLKGRLKIFSLTLRVADYTTFITRVKLMELDQKDCSLKVEKLIENHAWTASEKQLLGRTGSNYDLKCRDPLIQLFNVISLKADMFNNANVLLQHKFVDSVSTVQRTVTNKQSK